MNALPVGLSAEPGTSVCDATGGWRTERPRFLDAACTGCDLCVAFCPEGIVYRVEPKRYAFVDDYCKGCGICAAECPVNDIVMEPDVR
jgi:pyruvate ferredoxin oxidoreductase delta subunit